MLPDMHLVLHQSSAHVGMLEVTQEGVLIMNMKSLETVVAWLAVHMPLVEMQKNTLGRMPQLLNGRLAQFKKLLGMHPQTIWVVTFTGSANSLTKAMKD